MTYCDHRYLELVGEGAAARASAHRHSTAVSRQQLGIVREVTWSVDWSGVVHWCVVFSHHNTRWHESAPCDGLQDSWQPVCMAWQHEWRCQKTCISTGSVTHCSCRVGD